MKITDVNFVEQKFVSVAEQKKNKKLKFTAAVGAIFFLVITLAVSLINFYFQNQLVQLKTEEQKLIAEISSAQNKKKETLYYLTKDRLQKINELINTKSFLSGELSQIKKISELFTIKIFSIDEKTAKLEIETNDYTKFNDFLKNLEEYGVNRKSVVVSQTNYADEKYRILLNFHFL